MYVSFLIATFPTTETGFQCQEIQRVSSTGKMLSSAGKTLSNNKKVMIQYFVFSLKLSILTPSNQVSQKLDLRPKKTSDPLIVVKTPTQNYLMIYCAQNEI